MISILHNFDETKFKWLWAKYVKAGNIEKHCTASIPGAYSKKFSGTSNHDLLSQPTMVMDEVPEGQYEAIYFCGVLKAGYLNKNPLKNNYRHNVHFAVLPVEGEHDVWDFENWHVEIEGGKLEPIPAVYELGERFLKEPYNSHYYTCRIFRWMVGHFYPNELRNLFQKYAAKSKLPNAVIEKVVLDLINRGKAYAKDFIDSDNCWGYFEDSSIKNAKFKYDLVNRIDFANYIYKNVAGGLSDLPLEYYLSYLHDGIIPEKDIKRIVQLGIEEELDMFFPYQERNLINLENKEYIYLLQRR